MQYLRGSNSQKQEVEGWSPGTVGRRKWSIVPEWVLYRMSDLQSEKLLHVSFTSVTILKMVKMANFLLPVFTIINKQTRLTTKRKTVGHPH